MCHARLTSLTSDDLRRGRNLAPTGRHRAAPSAGTMRAPTRAARRFIRKTTCYSTGEEIAICCRMLKRLLVMLTVMAVFLGVLGFVKFKQIQVAIAQGASFQPPPEAVTTIVASEEQWPSTLNAIGTLAAVQGVTMSADLPGTIDRIAFDSGKTVRAGDVLVELDTRQERAQLAAAEAQRDLARLTFDRMQGLLKENVVSRAEYDRATADSRQGEARVGEIRASIERKTIKAP